jgi:hypothetical protein
MNLKTLLTLTLLALTTLSHAVSTYYPQEFLNSAANGKIQNDDLKAEIVNVLTSEHQKNNGAPDSLGCKGNQNCYRHTVLGYDGARKVLFGRIHIKKNDKGYFIKDVYCRKIFTAGNANVGPNSIPSNGKINCEHTWPQSKFNRSFDKETQKSDLHHLYPTDSHANSVRGNFNFAEISDQSGSLNDCEASKSGSSVTSGGDNYFEPPQEHKGNVARALFYFSVRYNISINEEEEEILRRWHMLDPVDDEEMQRNEIIYETQRNRNPFIDFPSMANYIKNF